MFIPKKREMLSQGSKNEWRPISKPKSQKPKAGSEALPLVIPQVTIEERSYVSCERRMIWPIYSENHGNPAVYPNRAEHEDRLSDYGTVFGQD